MDAIKVVNFQRDNPGIGFPEIESMSPGESESVRDRVASLLGVRGGVDGLAIVKAIREKAKLLPDVDAESDGFSLKQLHISLHESVFLNWKRFEIVDRMRTEDVNRWFGYLWYPSADDLDIIDSQFEWIASIAHSGEIYVVRF